jgi:hypothetical protein
MRFQKPFYYDPSQGNLLIEHIWRATGSPVPQPMLDFMSTSDFTTLVGGDPNATKGTLVTGRAINQFEFAPAPPGDFNMDGTVDAANFVVWRKGLRTIYTQADYDRWRAHYGQVVGNGAAEYSLDAFVDPLSAGVPEPACALLLGLGVFGQFSVRPTRPSSLRSSRRPVCEWPFRLYRR